MWRPRAFAEIFGGTKCCGKYQNSPKILLENVLILNENVNCHNTIVNMTLYIWDSGSQYLLFNIFTWKKPVYVSCKLLVFFQNLIDKKKTKLYGPFLWMGFNCLKATATSRRQFTFYHSVPRNYWYSFYRPRKNERLSRPWSHPVVLNMWPLDWESSALTTRPLLHKVT